jgi:hypothetical protein
MTVRPFKAADRDAVLHLSAEGVAIAEALHFIAIATRGTTSPPPDRVVVPQSALVDVDGATRPLGRRYGDPRVAAKLAAKLTDDPVLEGMVPDVSNPLTCVNRRLWMRSDTLRRA